MRAHRSALAAASATAARRRTEVAERVFDLLASGLSRYGAQVRENRRVSRPTMFEFTGGEPAFLRLAGAHHERCLADPVLNHPFSHPGQHPQHVQRLAWYWAEVFGGPPRFSESCGGHSAMMAIHAGTGAGEDFGPRFVACFVQAADDAGLPEDPEFRAGLRSYMEWAVAEVLSYSPPGSTVPPDRPMPRWSWNGLQEGQVWPRPAI